MTIIEKTDLTFHQTAANWTDFQRNWGGLHNLMLDGAITRFEYQLPPLERIIEEARFDDEARVRKGVKADAFDLTEITDEFRVLPLEEAIQSRFVLAHFNLADRLSGAGQVFEGIEERWVEPWRRQLTSHGFSFERVFPILFASGPHSASNYHLDITHQLAWQCYGTKYFYALKDPDAWTSIEQRARCELRGSVKPEGVRDEDTYAVPQPPGTMLWNPITIPHWVETFNECAVTLTLVHEKLRLNGELCAHGNEREAWLGQQAQMR